MAYFNTPFDLDIAMSTRAWIAFYDIPNICNLGVATVAFPVEVCMVVTRQICASCEIAHYCGGAVSDN